MRPKRKPKKFLHSRLTLVFSLIILGFVLVSLGKILHRKYLIDREIGTLKSEVAKLEENNKKVEELIKYLESESYLEKAAREKFGLQKEGERAVIITQNQPEQDNSQEDSNDGLQIRAKSTTKEYIFLANWLKWWEYFFGE